MPHARVQRRRDLRKQIHWQRAEVAIVYATGGFERESRTAQRLVRVEHLADLLPAHVHERLLVGAHDFRAHSRRHASARIEVQLPGTRMERKRESVPDRVPLGISGRPSAPPTPFELR